MNTDIPTVSKYLLDTSLIIAAVRNQPFYQRVSDKFNFLDSEVYISIVSMAEAKAFALHRKWGEQQQSRLNDVLHRFRFVPIDNETLVDIYALIDSYSLKVGRNMGKNDLWIAATANFTNAILLTTDKDFDHLDVLLINRIWINPAATV